MTESDRRAEYHRSERLVRNDASKDKAEHDREPWTEYEDTFLQEVWGDPGTPDHTEANLAEIAEAIGRTIEACRERYYKVRRAEAITYSTRTVTERKGQTETRTSEVEKRRPAWMDEEDLPDWYV